MQVLFCSSFSGEFPRANCRRRVLRVLRVQASRLQRYCDSMHAAILQATAEMRAAPRPLPSSDWMKVISQWGARSLTVLWNLSRKLR